MKSMYKKKKNVPLTLSKVCVFLLHNKSVGAKGLSGRICQFTYVCYCGGTTKRWILEWRKQWAYETICRGVDLKCGVWSLEPTLQVMGGGCSNNCVRQPKNKKKIVVDIIPSSDGVIDSPQIIPSSTSLLIDLSHIAESHKMIRLEPHENKMRWLLSPPPSLPGSSDISRESLLLLLLIRFNGPSRLMWPSRIALQAH